MSDEVTRHVTCIIHPENAQSVIYQIAPAVDPAQLAAVIDGLPLQITTDLSEHIVLDEANDRVLIDACYPLGITVGTTPDSGVHRTVFNAVGKLTKRMPLWDSRLRTDNEEF